MTTRNPSPAAFILCRLNKRWDKTEHHRSNVNTSPRVFIVVVGVYSFFRHKMSDLHVCTTLDIDQYFVFFPSFSGFEFFSRCITVPSNGAFDSSPEARATRRRRKAVAGSLCHVRVMNESSYIASERSREGPFWISHNT